MSRAFRHANNEFRAAQQAVERMLHARDFDGFEIGWRDFLAAIEKTWVKVERLCKKAPGFQQWQMKFKDLRSSDPLLRYVYQARHVDTLKFYEGFVSEAERLFSAHARN